MTTRHPTRGGSNPEEQDQPGGRPPGRWPARAARLTSKLLLSAVLVVAVLLAAFQAEPVRRALLATLTDVVAAQTGWKLKVGSLSGLWPLSLRLGDVSLSDGQGEWLSIADASVSVLPWPSSQALLELDAAFRQVRLSRIPPGPPATPSPPGHPLAFLDGLTPIPLPFSVRVEAEGLRLDEPVAGRALAFDVSAHARNTRDALSLEALAERLDGPSTRVEFRAGLDPRGRAASLALGLEEAPGGLVSELAGLGAGSSLSVQMEGAGPLRQWSARITGARAGEEVLDGTVSASLGASSTEDARFGLDLSVRPGALPLAGQAGAALGQKAELAFRGLVTSAGLASPQWKFLVEELAVTAEAGSVRLRGDAGVGGLSPKVSFQAALSNPAALGLAVGPVTLQGDMEADIDPSGPLTARANLEAPDLARTLEPLRVDLGGVCRVRAGLEGDTAKKELSLLLEGGLHEISPGKDETWVNAAAVLGRDVILQARAVLDSRNIVTLSQTRIAAKAFSAEASGTYSLDSTETDVGLSLELADLSPLSGLAGKPLSGNLTGASRLRGTAAAPVMTARFEGARLAYDATRFDKAGAEFEAEVLADGSSRGRVSASVSRANARLGLDTRFGVTRDRLTLSGLRLTGPGVDASGELDLGLAATTASGRLKAVADLNRLGAFLNTPMAGTARLESVLTASGLRQDATLELAASGVKGFGMIVTKAEASGAATDIARAPQGRLAAAVAGAKMGTVGLESLTLQAAGSGKEASFSLKAKGVLPEPFEARAAGVFASAPGGGRLLLKELQANAYATKLALVRPTALTFGPEGFSLADLSMTLGAGRITASGEMKANAVSLSADVLEIPLELLGKAKVADVSGRASARLRVAGAPQNPRVNASVELSQVRYAGLQNQAVPEVQVTADAEYSQGLLVSNCRMTAGDGVSLEARAAVPARLSLSPAGFSLPGEAALEATLRGSAELATFAAFSGQEGLDMRGVLKLDLKAGGRLNAPEVIGGIGIENGAVEYPASGTVLRGLTLRVEAEGAKFTLREFSASDASNGRISAHGQAEFPPDGQFSLAMDISLDKAALVRTDMATATLSGRLGVSGDRAGVLVKGSVSTGQVEVNIPERIPPDATPVEVEFVNAPRGMAAEAREAGAGAQAPIPVRLEIDVDFPGRIFVRGYGLDSVWDGRLHVGGWANAPAVSGDINVVRGRIDFFGKQFNMVRGTVSFTGGPPGEPRLDIDAQHQGTDITADILVTGDAKNPKVSFSSIPPLPQDEVLAQVLFGKSVSGLTAPQALQLGMAVASFSGKGSAVDLLGKTRKLAGLDYLGIGSSKGSDSGQMSITAGKYISDKVYVETSQGLGGQGPSVSVQVDVFPNVTLDSTMGMDSKTGVGLNWKMDY